MKILTLDIETAPNRVYSWGLFNQNISIGQIDKPGYILCWAAKWLGEKEIMFAAKHENGYHDMLQQMYDLLEQADVVVHYNGTSFDMKWLNGEFLRYGFTPPSPYQQIDLLYTVKRRFRLVSNKLDFLLRHLDFEGKVKTDFDLWVGCMDGDAKSLKKMEKYNKADVKRTEQVYKFIRPWITNHPNHALYQGDRAVRVCPNCGSEDLYKRGTYKTAVMEYQRYHCNDCGAWAKARTNNLPKEKRAVIVKGIG